MRNRIGDLDAKLTNKLEKQQQQLNTNNNDLDPSAISKSTAAHSGSSVSAAASSSAAHDATFVRSRCIPYGLHHFQPKERVLCQGVTKQLRKEFDETNQKLSDIVHLKIQCHGQSAQ